MQTRVRGTLEERLGRYWLKNHLSLCPRNDWLQPCPLGYLRRIGGCELCFALTLGDTLEEWRSLYEAVRIGGGYESLPS